MIGKVIVRVTDPYRPLDLERIPLRSDKPAAYGVFLGVNGLVSVSWMIREEFASGGNLEQRRHRLWADENGKPYLFASENEARHAVNQHFRSERIEPTDLLPSHTDLMREPLPWAAEV
jgi:hypothetical protein